MTNRSGLERLGRALMEIGAWPGRAAGWLIVPMTAMVLAAVIGSMLKVGQIASWQTDLPLFGSNLTLNGLAELQWHMLAIIVMLGISYAMNAMVADEIVEAKAKIAGFHDGDPGAFLSDDELEEFGLTRSDIERAQAEFEHRQAQDDYYAGFGEEAGPDADGW